MTAERWQQVKAVFDNALKCEPAARAAFLSQVGAVDPDMRTEVERWLAAATIPPLVLKDRYEVERELGRGGMSVVYLARDRQLLDKRVVVKVLHEQSHVDPWVRQKFQQEMEALARIDHPGVVGVLDHGLTLEGKQYLVMQYIEGTTLREAITPEGMALARAAGILRQIGQALAAAHDKGVWHRDLKPENIMLQALGGEVHVKLIDFGIAGIQNSRFAGLETKVAGSLAYMAPEQFAGHPCAASDIYALGVVACEMLTGSKSTSSDSTVQPRTSETLKLPGLRDSRPEVPVEAERCLLKALSFRPEQRHISAREFSEELYCALTGVSDTLPRRASGSGTVEIAHVLFTDLIGYSLLPMDLQKDYLAELQLIVRDSPRFRAAEQSGELISLPTGDGMALAFSGDPTAPAQCAIEVAERLKSRPHLKLRMGINSGPVYRVADVNANANLAGGGINMAQRVMDCGDAGHILVSKSVADVLCQLSPWAPHLIDLGECPVKHGVKVHLYNLVTGTAGNRARPGRLSSSIPIPRRRSNVRVAGAVLLLSLALGAAWWFTRGRRSTAAVPDEASIAVLPFADMSPEKNQTYFADGLAEELLDWLARIPGLRVAARTSSFQFRDRGSDFRDIGSKLQVGTILEGSVRKQGNRARIGVQLIKSADGFQLWSESFDRDMSDILAVQQDIARAVTGALKLTLLNRGQAPSSRDINAEAYSAFLQGRYFFGRRTRDGVEKASNYFEQAVQIDPLYARAWAGLGASRSNQAMKEYIPREEGFRAARAAVNQALALDPNLGEAYSALAVIAMFNDWDWAAADAASRKALALEPGSSRAIAAAATLARVLGRFEEAISLFRRATQLDPLSSGAYHNLGLALYHAGRYGEAAQFLHKALELVPEKEITHSLLGLVNLAQGNPAGSLAEAELEKNPQLRLSGRALAQYALGKRSDADASLAELVVSYANDSPSQIAEIYAYRGEKDQAFEWLDRAYAGRDAGVTEIKGNPLFRGLERDPRHAALIAKLGLR